MAELTAKGLSYTQIAAELGISAGTVDTHMKRTRHKTGAHSQAELTAWWTAHAITEDT